MSDHHGCKAAVVGCMDFRLHADRHSQLEEEFETFDVITLAGGAHALLKPDTAAVILANLETSVRLHHVNAFVLTVHEDCGACGGSKAFANRAAEMRHHHDALVEAAAVVREHFGDGTPEIVLVIQYLNGTVEYLDEEELAQAA